MPQYIIPSRYKVRGFTAAECASRNEILLEREQCFETDTGRSKIGDGSTRYNDLPYVNYGSADLTDLADGDIMQWNATLAQWLPVSVAYTDEQAQDAAAAMIAAGSHTGITFTYDDANNKISALVGSGASEVDLPQVFHAFLGKGSQQILLPQNNNASATTMGWPGSTTTGSQSAVAVASTSAFTRQTRFKVATSASTAGSSCGIHQTSLTMCLTGGFLTFSKHGISDAASVANARWFSGLRGSTTVIGNVNPSTLTDIIGFGADTGDTNVQVMHNDGSGSATKVDLGANFPANTQSTDVYQMYLYAAAGASTVSYYIKRLNTGHTATGTISTNLPGSTTMLAYHSWRNNGTTALTVSYDISSMIMRSNLE